MLFTGVMMIIMIMAMTNLTTVSKTRMMIMDMRATIMMNKMTAIVMTVMTKMANISSQKIEREMSSEKCKENKQNKEIYVKYI